MNSNIRWVWLTYAVLALMVAYTGYQITEAIISVSGIQDPLGTVVSLGSVIGLVLGAVTLVVLVKHPHTTEFGLEVVKEIRKATWPTMPETRAATVVVLVMVAIMGVILGVFDWIFSSLTGLIYS